MTRWLLMVLAISPWLASCDEPSPEAAPVVHFMDVTDTTGLDFVTTCGGVPSTEILEVAGGGVALFDFDNDNDPDLFVANGATLESPRLGPGSRLFRNDSTPGQIRYIDVTSDSGIDLNRWAMGTAAGDIDGDGFIDLHVTCWGPNALLRNRGDGTFEDITDTAGLDDEAWSTSSAFGDVDGDGDLDLYVVNYLEFDPASLPPTTKYKGQTVPTGPQGLTPQADRLWINNGDGTFSDAIQAGVLESITPAYGLNVVIIDFDGDQRQDIVVGNDSMANDLFIHNESPGEPLELLNTGRHSGLAANLDGSEQATMGMAIGDVDGDGRPDLFTTNFSADTNTLHRSMDNGGWQDRTRQYGLGMPSRPWLGWTTTFIDLDYDNDEDLIILNGHVYPNATLDTMDAEYEQPPQVLIRDGDRFVQLEATPTDTWLGIPRRDRAGALGDLDGDGDFDLVTAELNGPVRIIENRTTPPRSMQPVIVHLVDDRPGISNRTGLGSRIRSLGTPITTRWDYSGGPFQSASDSAAAFSIPVDLSTWKIAVNWPDGTETRHQIRPAARVTIRHTEGLSKSN
ncbi:MAG: VCBS repeat-containing protein [Planctomycetota bacterium]|nr:VCBS repeat-containing protein [Planctomycetota bacterium]